MLSIKVGKSLIWCLFPINVFESKLDGSVFRVICRPYTEMICDYFNWGYVIYLLDSILVSMLLLILVLEVHNRMLHNAVKGGYLAAFQVEEGSEGVMDSSPLLFAHDTMLFVT